MPHLRAAAGIFADVQADEIVRYFEDGACDKRKSFFTQSLRVLHKGGYKKARDYRKLHHIDNACAHPFMKRNICPPFHTDAAKFYQISFRPPKVVLMNRPPLADFVY